MLTRILFGLIVAVVMAGGSATAENLALSGTDRWVAVASRQDFNEAISIAKTYAAQNSRVVRSQNGWFAVVLGPYATSDIATFRRSYAGPSLPRDAMLTGGVGYVETVWKPARHAEGLKDLAKSLGVLLNCAEPNNVDGSLCQDTGPIYRALSRAGFRRTRGDEDRAHKAAMPSAEAAWPASKRLANKVGRRGAMTTSRWECGLTL